MFNRRSHRLRKMATAASFYELEPRDQKDSVYSFNSLEGKVVLIVNGKIFYDEVRTKNYSIVASKCGFTPVRIPSRRIYFHIFSC